MDPSAGRRSVAAAAAAASSAPKKPTPRLPNGEDDVSLRPPSTTALTDGGDAASAAAFAGDLLALGVWADDIEGAKPEGEEGGEEEEEDKDKDGDGAPPEGAPPLFTDPVAAAWDAKSGGLLSDAARAGGFKAKAGQSATVRLPKSAAGGGGPKHLTVVGLGRRAAAAAGDPAWGGSPFAGLGGAVAAAAKATKAREGAVLLTGGGSCGQGVEPPTAVAALARGLLTGAHAATRFKHGPGPARLASAALFGFGPGVDAGVAAGSALARGITLARYLVEAPPNVCTPAHVARAARDVAAGAPDVLTCKVYDAAACKAMGMGAFLGVSAASARPPALIHLTYTPPGGPATGPDAPPPLALVGKGVTFDSGGYNLKVGGMIEQMKFDMAGAGAVVGVADALAAARPVGGPVVHLIAACCENLIGPASLLPGDVLTTAAGKTVEVNNTDAEGRLILADALWFAQEKAGGEGEEGKVGAIVDIATLTGEEGRRGEGERGERERGEGVGRVEVSPLFLSIVTRTPDALPSPPSLHPLLPGACMVALGPSIAGLYAADDGVAAAVSAAARAAGEKVWRMPLEGPYWEGMASPVADMKNSGGRFGGSITAALFLKQFINAGVGWAHLDIAGPAWEDKAGGATGFGVTTMYGLAVGGLPSADAAKK